MEEFDALKLADHKRDYILNKLNPLLEHMVADAIQQMPPDPVPFLLDYLECKRVEEQEKLLTEQERDQLMAENESLREDVAKTAAKVGEAAGLVQHEEGAEEEEDDQDDEPPPDFFKENTGPPKARASVSAEAYGEWNTKKKFTAPVIQKTSEQQARLKATLQKSFLFSSVESSDFDQVIGAMKEVTLKASERIIKQGDDGDFLFVIESGKLNCIMTAKDGTEKVVKTCESGDVFGELALLYNCPRAANVDAVEACVLWQLDRDTFNNIVKEAAQKKRQRYDNFLSKVSLLTSMDAYERSQISDALKSETFEVGAIIVNQGDPGHKFYIIEEGAAVATKGSQQVMSYAAGDYFGELALIRNQPRAATVTCHTQVKVLSLDSASFNRLLNVSQLLERSARYA